MRLFEYHTEDIASNELEDATLNELGEDGWELVAVVSVYQAHRHYFKRPKKREKDVKEARFC